MGLFGWNAEKKLAKGQEQLAKGHYYEARLTFEEILIHDKIGNGIIAQARDGWRKARAALIELQAAEARQLLAAGDPRAASECWQAIIELAGEDLDAGDAREMLARHGGAPRLQEKILEGLEAVEPPGTLPAEEEGEEEHYAEDPEEMFEVYLQTLPEKQAEAYRALGLPFRDGYLLIQEGREAEALDQLAAVDEVARDSPYFRLEMAQALVLAERHEEALNELDVIEPPVEIRRRVAEMRAVLLDQLGSREEAESEARRVWEEGQDLEAAALYGEILVTGAQFDRALEIVKPFVHPTRPQPEIDRIAARAYAGLGQFGEMRNLLERAVEAFFQGPVGMRDAPAFPLWAARDLLDLYVAANEPPERVRSLVQHLIRHDPPSAEKYKSALADYARRLEDQTHTGAPE